MCSMPNSSHVNNFALTYVIYTGSGKYAPALSYNTMTPNRIFSDMGYFMRKERWSQKR